MICVHFCLTLREAMNTPTIPASYLLYFSVTAVRLPDMVTFIVYEFWEREEDWKR